MSVVKKKEKGFTLVELLLALAVFSFVLIFVTTAFLQIFRTYTRGITRKDVNQTARLAVNDITSKMRTVNEASQINVSQIDRGRLCLGGYSYVWNPVVRPDGWTENRVYGESINFVRIDGDNGAVACDPNVSNIVTGSVTSVFPENIGVLNVNIEQLGGVSDLFRLRFTASTSQLDLLDELNRCTVENNASAYCSQITLESTIGIRNR